VFFFLRIDAKPKENNREFARGEERNGGGREKKKRAEYVQKKDSDRRNRGRYSNLPGEGEGSAKPGCDQL